MLASSSTQTLKRRLLLSAVICFASSQAVIAQSYSEEDKVLDYDPFLSPSSLGQSSADIYSAKGFSALSSNPAGIGEDGPSSSYIQHFYLLRTAVQANQNSFELLGDMSSKGGSGDLDIGRALINAQAGKRQFARYQVSTSLGFGNMIFTPIYDNQMAARAVGNDTDLMDIHFKESSGMAFGAGFGGKNSRFRLGASTSVLTSKDTQGQFTYSSLVSSEERPKITKDATVNYSSAPINIGGKFLINPKWQAHTAVVIKDFGGTKYKSSKPELRSSFSRDQNLLLGFGLSPKMGRYVESNFNIQGENLESKTISVKKRLSFGCSFSFFGSGEDAPFSVQTGVRDSGISFGSSLNFGLIVFQYSNHAEDIGIDNKRVIERQQSAVFLVNLVE